MLSLFDYDASPVVVAALMTQCESELVKLTYLFVDVLLYMYCFGVTECRCMERNRSFVFQQ